MATNIERAAQILAIVASRIRDLDLNTDAIEGSLTDIATALQIMDDWDETNRAAVNTIAGQVGVQGGSGGVTALTQRVVLATDVALPTGTNAIGKLAANTGVDIGDVDVTSIAAGENHLGAVGGHEANPSANFTRPADTTAYASGELVANSTTAASVVALTFTAARVAAGSFLVRRARLHKSTEVITLGTFRLHLFNANPVAVAPTAGDNSALELNSLAAGAYLGYFDFDFTATGVPDIQASDIEMSATPATGTEITVKLAAGTDIYGLLEARAAYVPGNAEVFTVTLEVIQS